MSSIDTVTERAKPFLVYTAIWGLLGLGQLGLAAFAIWHGKGLRVADAFGIVWLAAAAYNFKKYSALRTRETV